MKTFSIIVFSVFIGSLLGWQLTSMLQHAKHMDTPASDEAKTPLYWVAPMDDSYRRDQPGKSPMGMDLVPVYAQSASSASDDNSLYISPQVQQNMGVKTVKATVRPLEPVIATVGRVTFNEDALVHLHPRVEGWVETLHINTKGQRVTKGDPVYTLYSPQLVSAQEDYVIALNSGNRQLIEGAKERLISLQVSETLINQLATRKTVSQSVTFYAPQSGVVENLNVKEGLFVKPGTEVISIAPLNTVWVILDVFEAYLNRIARGQAVTLSFDALPAEAWQANIDFIYPTLNPQTQTLMARVTLANEQEKLRPGMFANAKIQTQGDEPSSFLTIPHQALIRTQDQQRVVVRQGKGQFKSVAVTTGARDENHVAVLKGLLPGDEVVVSAQFLIDSESSKSADFTRMAEPQNQATVNGVIQAMTPAMGTMNPAILTIAREPIKKWQRPAATMDFVVSPHLDISGYQVGDKVQFTFTVQDDFVILAIAPAVADMMREHQHQDAKPTHAHHKMEVGGHD